jgi:hypothetical protein
MQATVQQKVPFKSGSEIPDFVQVETIDMSSPYKPTDTTVASKKKRKYEGTEERKKKRREWESRPENIEKRKKYNEREDVKARQREYYQEPEVKNRRRQNAKFHREWKKTLGYLMKEGRLYHKSPTDGTMKQVPVDPKLFLDTFFPLSSSQIKADGHTYINNEPATQGTQQ